MGIVVGWYSFKIKSYSAADLKINKDDFGNATFEVRQKVFHLFWLPFFSIGKSYALRREGKLYELPESIISRIKTKEKIATPWYSFFLPIAILTGFIVSGIVIYVGEFIMRHNSYLNEKEQYEIAITDVQKTLSKLPPNAYLRIVNFNKPERDKALYLKVLAIKGNTYKCMAIEAKIPLYENENYYLHAITSDTLTFTKSQLQSAVCTEYENFQEKKSCGFAFLGGTDTYGIDAIHYFDEPIMEGEIDWDFWRTIRRQEFQYLERFTGNQYDHSWTITLNLQNFGIPVNLVKIKNREGDINWMDSLPKRFTTYEYLKDIPIQGSIKTEPKNLKFKSVLTFQDSLSRNYEFIIEGKESFFTIKRIKTTGKR